MTAEFGSIKTRVARFTRLDDCGDPVEGPTSTIVTDGYTNIDPSPQYEDGASSRIANGWGDFIVNEEDDPRLIGANLTINAHKVHPATLDIVTSARQVMDPTATPSPAPVGSAYKEGAITARFSLETWTKVIGADACSGGTRWIYWAFVHLGNGRLGDLSLGAEAVTFTLTASTKAASTGVWIAGDDHETDGLPYALSYMPDEAAILSGEHWYFGLTDEAPPAVTDGPVAYAAPA